MNDEFVKNVLSNGEKGKEWLEKIPEKIKTYENHWMLEVLSPYRLTYNYVAPAIRRDNSRAVLKIGMPWDNEFLNEIDALKIFDGNGIARLLAEDKANAVILIEEIRPGIPLSTIDNDDAATRILAQTMKKIWKPLPKDNSFITIFDWTKEIREYPQKTIHKTPLELVREGIALFDYLLISSKKAVLTHGDLHHDNVLSSDIHRWAGIDPKGIAAEPLYDVAALIRNPYKKIKKMDNIDKLLRRRILILSDELDADPKRIHQWCLAQTILSRVWTEDNEEYTAHAMKVINALKRITF